MVCHWIQWPIEWNLVPFYKNCHKEIIKNYSPVSLLPICGKTIERFVFNLVFVFLEESNLLSALYHLEILENVTPRDIFQSGSIETFWNQKIRQEKLSQFMKIYKVFFYNFLCQTVLLFSLYILPTKYNWNTLV